MTKVKSLPAIEVLGDSTMCNPIGCHGQQAVASLLRLKAPDYLVAKHVTIEDLDAELRLYLGYADRRRVVGPDGLVQSTRRLELRHLLERRGLALPKWAKTYGGVTMRALRDHLRCERIASAFLVLVASPSSPGRAPSWHVEFSSAAGVVGAMDRPAVEGFRRVRGFASVEVQE